MPAVSKAQWRAMGAKLKRGEISKKEFDHWTKGVDYDRLPERVKRKRKALKRRAKQRR